MVKTHTMKRYLILILVATLVLASGLWIGCGQKETTAELIAFLATEEPIIERHAETVDAINKATEAITSEAEKPVTPKDESSASSKTQMEAIEPPKPSGGVPVSIHSLSAEEIIRSLKTPIPTPKPTIPSGLKEALTSGVDTLDWALEQIDSEIVDYKRLNPPPEARVYHGLTVEILLKEQAIYNDIRSHYRSLLSYGYGDDEALDRVKKLSEEVSRLHLLVQYEWDDLIQRIEQ